MTEHTAKFDVAGVGLTADDYPPLEQGPFDPRALWFPSQRRDHPLEIEIGSGKGTFLVQQAALQPGTNFLGIEYAGEFYRYAADRIRRHGLNHVRLLHADGRDFVQYRLATACCDVIHVYFPDPWPKRRHHKRRMIQVASLDAFHRVLIPGGQVRIVTDHSDYWAWMQDIVAESTSLFEAQPFCSPDSASDGELVGTNFERKYRRQGRPFHATILHRKP
ncbi:MAG: tRNA (guanosine(46)-N7)-methyltransferase TrmB [Planctomycetes bacterium]|nr:tRNA (guanosine(46)-N7)-methyltransferase TrmB [Planctomycetota bacterium]